MRKCIRVYKLSDIPVEFASKKGWNGRGFKVPSSASALGRASHWNGMYYLNFDLYHLGQCIPIRGMKASARRVEYWKLHEEKIGAMQCL